MTKAVPLSPSSVAFCASVQLRFLSTQKYRTVSVPLYHCLTRVIIPYRNSLVKHTVDYRSKSSRAKFNTLIMRLIRSGMRGRQTRQADSQQQQSVGPSPEVTLPSPPEYSRGPSTPERAERGGVLPLLRYRNSPNNPTLDSPFNKKKP